MGRSPLGERGLKLLVCECNRIRAMSLSAWRAWIEIGITEKTLFKMAVALRLESVD